MGMHRPEPLFLVFDIKKTTKWKMASTGLMKVLRVSNWANLRRSINTSAVARSGRLSAHGVPHSDSGWTKWRTAFFLVAIPSIVAVHFSAFVFVDPEEHKRPEFRPYEYMRVRTKKFPWGDGNHGLFHNPHVNALPDGYEDEEEH